MIFSFPLGYIKDYEFISILNTQILSENVVYSISNLSVKDILIFKKH